MKKFLLVFAAVLAATALFFFYSFLALELPEMDPAAAAAASPAPFVEQRI